MTLEAEVGSEKTVGPSGVSEAIGMFQQSQAAEAEAAKKQTEDKPAEAKAADPAKPESTPADKGEEAGKGETEAEAAGPTLKLVDEKGNVVPLVFKADGKELTESDLNKIRQYVERGYHGSQRDEALNAKEKLLEQQLPIIEAVILAQKEGRLIIKDAAGKPAEAPPADAGKETDDDLLTDPKVKELEEKHKKTDEELKKISALIVKKSIDEGYAELKRQIEAKKAEFPAAREENVWKLLELNDKNTGKPLYDVESAMREAHEKETEFLMTVPLPEKRRQQIIADYLKEKAKDEEPPVGAPAGAGPGGVGGAAAVKEETPITGVADAIERFKREQTAKGGSASKF